MCKKQPGVTTFVGQNKVIVPVRRGDSRAQALKVQLYGIVKNTGFDGHS